MPVFLLDPGKQHSSEEDAKPYDSLLFPHHEASGKGKRVTKNLRKSASDALSQIQSPLPRKLPKLHPTLVKCASAGAPSKHAAKHSPAQWHGTHARTTYLLGEDTNTDFFPFLYELPRVRVRKKRPPPQLPPLDDSQKPKRSLRRSQTESALSHAPPQLELGTAKDAEDADSEEDVESKLGKFSPGTSRRTAALPGNARGSASMRKKPLRSKTFTSAAENESGGSRSRSNSASSSGEGEESTIKLTQAGVDMPAAPLYLNEGTSADQLLDQGWPAYFVRAWFGVEDAHGYTKADALPLFNAFSVFSGGDGSPGSEIHKDELPGVIQALGYLLCNKKAIEKLSDEVTHYSTLSFEQFLNFNREYANYERGEWKSHFDRHDFNNSGNIDVEELPTVLAELGYTPMREMVEEALHEVDKDNSNTIDLDEFIRLMDIYRRTEGFTKQDYMELGEVFKKFDLDADNTLSAEELVTLKKYLDLKGNEDVGGAGDQPIQSKEMPVDWRGFLAEMRRCREAEIKFFRKQFEQYDADGSGTLSTAELPKLLENAGYVPMRKALNEAITLVDRDCSGEIDFDEFLNLMNVYRRNEGFTEAEIEEQQAVFKKFDVDESDEISVMELNGILKEQGYIVNVVKLQNLCHDYDVDGSGDIGFREYLKIIRRFRETDLKDLKQLFRRFDMDGSGSMATQEIASLLLELGHEVSMPIVAEAVASVDEDRSGEVDWEEFVKLMDMYREITVREERRKCGFNDQEIENYQEVYTTYDADGSDNIEPKELMNVLSDLKMVPRSRDEQKKLVTLLKECRQKAGEKDESKVTFWVFLQLMRTLEDDKSRDSLAVERKAAEEANFSQEEVREFREIFFFWVDDLAETGDGTGVADGIRALSSDGVAKMLRSLGLSFTADDRHNLGNLCVECDHDKNGAVDFPDFLVLMRRLLDLNFAKIKDVTAVTAPLRSYSKKLSTSSLPKGV